MTKSCRKCSRELHAEDFPKNSRHADGLDTWCRTCLNEKMRTYRQYGTAKQAVADSLPVSPFAVGEWTEQATCASSDPEAFFPGKGESTADAKRVCVNCPVKAECLQYALKNDERFGVWGGLSERQRRQLRKGVAA